MNCKLKFYQKRGKICRNNVGNMILEKFMFLFYAQIKVQILFLDLKIPCLSQSQMNLKCSVPKHMEEPFLFVLENDPF